MSTHKRPSDSETEFDSVTDWEHIPTQKDGIKFATKDRTRTAICTPVSTSGGDVYNCIIYNQDTPYSNGKRETSTIATNRSEIPQTLQEEIDLD